MANIKSIGGNPIVLGLDGLTDDAKAALGNGKLSSTSESILGADSTAQWAQRESTGSGAATVRSVQGVSVVWNQMAQNGNFSNGTHWNKVSNHFSWTTTDNTAVLTATDGGYSIGLSSDVVTLVDGHKYLVSCYAKTSNANVLYISLNSSSNTINAIANNVALSNAFKKVSGIVTYSLPSDGTNRIRIATSAGTTASGDVLTLANVQLFDLTLMFGAGNEPATVAEFEAMYPEAYYPYSAPTLKPVRIAGIASTDAQGGELDSVEWTAQTLRAAGSVRDELTSDKLVTRVGERNYQSGDESDATVRTDGTTTYYPLATPTTTPISPALPMTYRVQAGGSESIIVPDGEVSAAPVLTVAEGESAADVVMDALACIAAPDGPTATANHSVGTYLTMQGKLYKVTSAIAVGETIKSGTNVTATTVMDEILALN